MSSPLIILSVTFLANQVAYAVLFPVASVISSKSSKGIFPESTNWVFNCSIET
jgi:hypothetical protein